MTHTVQQIGSCQSSRRSTVNSATIIICAEDLRCFTSATPVREMLRDFVDIRAHDQYVMVFDAGSESEPWVRPYLETLPRERVAIATVKRNRRVSNLLEVLGFPDYSRPIPEGDLYLRFDVGRMGEKGKPLVGLVTDLSSQNPATSSIPWHGRILFRRRLKESVEQAAAIVAISKYTARDVAAHFPSARDRIRVIPNGIADQWFEMSDIERGGESFSWIWYGQITKRKNLTGLLRAYALCRSRRMERIPTLELISGRGAAYAEIERLIGALRLGDCVKIISPLPLEQLIRRVQASKGLVFPSFHEGFGMPIVEAMALGRPVFTSNLTAMPEVAGGHAILCDPSDVESIATGLERMLDPAFDSREARTARCHWAGQFTARRAAEAYDRLIDEILARTLSSSQTTTTAERGRTLPSLSVIIPTLGRDQFLQDTLRCLSRQDYPDWECVIVYQGEIDGRLAEQLKDILPGKLRIFYLEGPNASLARNIGLLEGRGEIALFLDDDVLIQSTDFLKRHGQNYLAPECSGVVGQVLSEERMLRPTRHWMSYWRRNGWLYFPMNFTERVAVRNGGSNHLSVRRHQAIAVGGMDAQFEKGAHREESDFCLRYTDRFGLMVFDPQATLVHLGEPHGGCRTWGMNAGVHPRHHVAGEWYFILRGLRCRTIGFFDLPHHLFMLLRRQIVNRANLRSPRQLWAAMRRSLEGLHDARSKLLASPRYIDSIDRKGYREL